MACAGAKPVPPATNNRGVLESKTGRVQSAIRKFQKNLLMVLKISEQGCFSAHLLDVLYAIHNKGCIGRVDYGVAITGSPAMHIEVLSLLHRQCIARAITART